LAIDGLDGRENVLTKNLDYPPPPFAVWQVDLVADGVGVNDVGTKSLEYFGDSALARPDAAGQSDGLHKVPGYPICRYRAPRRRRPRAQQWASGGANVPPRAPTKWLSRRRPGDRRHRGRACPAPTGAPGSSRAAATPVRRAADTPGRYPRFRR